MRRALIEAAEAALRLRNCIGGLGYHPDPWRHFGIGGVAEAERLCAEASVDLLAFVSPPTALEPTGFVRETPVVRATGDRELLRFDSPRPSGRPPNDVVELRVTRPRGALGADRVVLFHHALYQDRWSIWEWFTARLAERIPVAIMASPYHAARVPPGEFPGEGIVNPNPWRVFEAMRQWAWDQRAALGVLKGELGLEPVAIIGFSMGAFTSLLLAAAGCLPLPIVSIASTSRYAHGVVNGNMAYGLSAALAEVGIGPERLYRMTSAIELDRYASRLRGRPILYVDGLFDGVDPPPSLGRLHAALRPARSLRLPAGHASLLLHRTRITSAIVDFLAAERILDP